MAIRTRTRPEASVGELVDVGGYRLYLSIKEPLETQYEAPTVVMDTGLAHVSSAWALVQSEVAAFARVCVFDRAGYGWSDRGPLPRSGERIITELRAALQAASLPAPYTLVGHSFGGLDMLRYAITYPGEMAALVLVDALPPTMVVDEPANFRWFVNWNRWQYRLLARLTRIGLLRLYFTARGPEAGPAWVRELPPEQRVAALAEQLHGTYRAAAAEVEALPASMTELAAQLAPGALGALPLIVLAHGLPDLFAGRMSPREVEQAEAIWRRMQANLATLSTRGELRVVTDAGHRIHLQQPAAVIAAIKDATQIANK